MMLHGRPFHHLERRLRSTFAGVPARVKAAALPPERGAATDFAITLTWMAAGIGVVALGLAAGRELRSRYKFKRRTPYDYYAHSGDGTAGVDFGVGI